MINFLSAKKITPVNTVTIGITGKKGKTVVSHVIKDILTQNGFRVASLTSEGFLIDEENTNKKIKSNNITKKDLLNIARIINKIKPDFFVIEIPDSQLVKKFYSYLNLDAGVITNIEFNPEISNEKYLKSKLDFIKLVNEQGLLVVSGEDENFANWLEQNSENIENNIFCYWINSKNLSGKHYKKEGIEYNYYNEAMIYSQMNGAYSFINTYIAIRVCNRYLPLDKITGALRNVRPLKGKFDKFQETPFSIYIDEAITLKQIESSLNHIISVKGPTQKVITVVGVPEENTKELANIGSLVAKHSDIIILAPSDSNLTQTYDINSIIHSGAESFRGRLVERIYSTEELQLLDKKRLMQKIYNTMQTGDVPVIAFDAHDHTGRLDALKLAVLIADNDDIVYIAGKGSSESIIFNEIEYEWSDYEALKLAIDALKN